MIIVLFITKKRKTMDDKSAQTFGCFLGIMVTLIVTLALFWIIDLPLWAEYTIICVCAVVFGTLGIVVTRRFARPGLPTQVAGRVSEPPKSSPPSPTVPPTPPVSP